MKADDELYAYRRHLEQCPFFGRGGRDARADKCKCPFHVDGKHHGERSDNRSRYGAAKARIGTFQSWCGGSTRSTISGQTPIPELLSRCRRKRRSDRRSSASSPARATIEPDGSYRGDVERNTFRKYSTSLTLLCSFCDERAISLLVDVGVDALEDFRQTRKIGLVTWKVERQTLVTFFAYCVRRKWITTNPARELESPRNLKPNEVVPYTLKEESEILAACEQIGGCKYNRSGAKYEQRRARAMVLLLRNTALRISDVATFPKDAVSWDANGNTWRVRLRTQKSGEPVYLPIPDVLKLALDAVPLPRNAAQDCAFYFWNGHTSRRAMVGIAERTLSAVFKKSAVKHAHAHCYRHTLATRLLAQGATFEQVADILGNSPAVVRKHYGKWAKGRQDNIDQLMFEHFRTASATFPATEKSHENLGAVN
jgi:site-specific recombinase XerD